MEVQIRAFDRLNPPDELEDYHDAYIETMHRLWTLTDDAQVNVYSDQFFMMGALKHLRTASNSLLIDLYDALPEDTQDILKISGCVERRH